MNYFNFLSIFEQRQQYTLSLLNCEAAAFRFINRLFMALINITYKKKKKKKYCGYLFSQFALCWCGATNNYPLCCRGLV